MTEKQKKVQSINTCISLSWPDRLIVAVALVVAVVAVVACADLKIDNLFFFFVTDAPSHQSIQFCPW